MNPLRRPERYLSVREDRAVFASTARDMLVLLIDKELHTRPTLATANSDAEKSY